MLTLSAFSTQNFDGKAGRLSTQRARHKATGYGGTAGGGGQNNDYDNTLAMCDMVLHV